MRDRDLAPLVGVLLAGGESRRFGSPKPLARLGSTTFGARVGRALAETCDSIAIAGAGPLPPELEAWPRVADAPGIRGPIAGILGAMAAYPSRAVLAVACDQPLLRGEHLRWLVAQRSAGALGVFVRFDESRIQPLPGIYEPAAAAALAELARAGGSLQPFGERNDVVFAVPPAELAPGWTSVDTEERRRELEAALHEEHPDPAGVSEPKGVERPTIVERLRGRVD